MKRLCFPLRLKRGLCREEGAKIEIKLSAANHDKQRCPFCHADVLPSEETTECFRCTATFHDECWDEHGGCTNCPPLHINVSASRGAPIRRGRLIQQEQETDEPSYLVRRKQKAAAATYARSEAFLPALFAFAFTFVVTLVLTPQNNPRAFLTALGFDVLVALTIYGFLYVTERNKRMTTYRLRNLRRRRESERRSPSGAWEFGEPE